MTICVLHLGPSVPLSSSGLPKYTHLRPASSMRDWNITRWLWPCMSIPVKATAHTCCTSHAVDSHWPQAGCRLTVEQRDACCVSPCGHNPMPCFPHVRFRDARTRMQSSAQAVTHAAHQSCIDQRTHPQCSTRPNSGTAERSLRDRSACHKRPISHPGQAQVSTWHQHTTEHPRCPGH